jgi:D-glucosaminate-6-phosphate ammonia-lyase
MPPLRSAAGGRICRSFTQLRCRSDWRTAAVKHLGGPQASGVLCGRDDLIRSAWVQMVDMDVRGRYVVTAALGGRRAGSVDHPPRHGLGRSMKVSKESMIGLMVALQRYRERDHAAEYASWLRSVDEIYHSLQDLSSLRFTRLEQSRQRATLSVAGH